MTQTTNMQIGQQVGQQVQFTENAEHPRVLGTVSRVWPNGRYVTIISDGRTFVRETTRVTVTRDHEWDADQDLPEPVGGWETVGEPS